MDWQAAAKLMAMAVSAIDQIVDSVRGGSFEGTRAQQTTDALQAISTIVETVNAGILEDLDVEGIRADLDLLLTALGTNDDAADVAVDAKFDSSEG